jgi:hypothetical protein
MLLAFYRHGWTFNSISSAKTPSAASYKRLLANWAWPIGSGSTGFCLRTTSRPCSNPPATAGVLLAALCIAMSSWIVTAVYGVPYGYAAPAFAVLSLALPLFFLNYALTHQVIGWDGQRAYLWIAAVALAANVAANIALVPSQGMVGAAIATVITELVVTAGCLFALRTKRVIQDVREHVAV